MDRKSTSSALKSPKRCSLTTTSIAHDASMSPGRPDETIHTITGDGYGQSVSYFPRLLIPRWLWWKERQRGKMNINVGSPLFIAQSPRGILNAMRSVDGQPRPRRVERLMRRSCLAQRLVATNAVTDSLTFPWLSYDPDKEHDPPAQGRQVDKAGSGTDARLQSAVGVKSFLAVPAKTRSRPTPTTEFRYL
jgi:hypothetical protein